MSRKHNNSNVLTLGGRLIGTELSVDILETWLHTSFEGGRHIKRLQINLKNKILIKSSTKYGNLKIKDNRY